MKELFELLHWGVEINYNDGVILGLIALLYFIAISFDSSQTICERLAERKMDKGLFIFFIITFISYLIKGPILNSFIYEKYPLFLSYFELLRYLEIAIVFALVIVISYFIVLAFLYIRLIQFVALMFYLFIFYLILNYLIGTIFKINFITFDLFLMVSFGLIFLYGIKNYAPVIKNKAIFVMKNFYRNITCFFKDKK